MTAGNDRIHRDHRLTIRSRRKNRGIITIIKNHGGIQSIPLKVGLNQFKLVHETRVLELQSPARSQQADPEHR